MKIIITIKDNKEVNSFRARPLRFQKKHGLYR